MAALADPRPTIAATACQSLINHGPDVAPLLAGIASRPARGRAFGYAVFALSAIEDRTGRVLLSDEMLPHLLVELGGLDAFMKTTAALALANIAFRSEDTRGLRYGDRETRYRSLADMMALRDTMRKDLGLIGKGPFRKLATHNKGLGVGPTVGPGIPTWGPF